MHMKHMYKPVEHITQCHQRTCIHRSVRETVWECDNDRETEKKGKKWIIKSRARDWKSNKHNPITWRMTSNFMITICSSHISVLREHSPLPNGVYNFIEWLIANIQTKSCVCAACFSISLLSPLRFVSFRIRTLFRFCLFDTIGRMSVFFFLLCLCSLLLFLRWRRRRRWTSFWVIKLSNIMYHRNIEVGLCRQ